MLRLEGSSARAPIIPDIPGRSSSASPQKYLLNLTPFPSITIPIFKAILHSTSFISSLAVVERHHIAPIITGL